MDKKLTHCEDLFTLPGTNPFCKHVELYSATDNQSAEEEVSTFIRALVNLIKPEFIVETGCYKGNTTKLLMSACVENNFGKVLTCDTNKDLCDLVRDNLLKEYHQEVIDQFVEIHNITGLELLNKVEIIDFLFLDSGYESRGEELKIALSKLRVGGIIAIHDTGIQHMHIHNLDKIVIGDPRFTKFYFNTPRGLTIFTRNIF